MIYPLKILQHVQPRTYLIITPPFTDFRLKEHLVKIAARLVPSSKVQLLSSEMERLVMLKRSNSCN